MSSYVSILLLCTCLVTMATSNPLEAPQTTCSTKDLSSWGYKDYQEEVKVMGSDKIISMELQQEHTDDKQNTGNKLCEKNSTFGFTDTKLWVTNGCRATFMICYGESRFFDVELNTSVQVQDTFDINKPQHEVIDGVTWALFQRRTSASVDFNRTWADFTQGFGTEANFWVGLETIHRLCNKDSKCHLRVDMARDGVTKFAEYETFYIEGPDDNFRLHLTNYVGTAGDSMMELEDWSKADGAMFSASDVDNDDNMHINCANFIWGGPWWNSDCEMEANLNGQFGAEGFYWFEFAGDYDSLTFSEMKIRQIK